jgi:hypothetical protein
MNADKLGEMKFTAFTVYLDENPKRYATLSRYRKLLTGAKTKNNRLKLRHVEDQMKAILDKGLETKRRKAGTGERVMVKMVYKDTPGNRRADRVGKEYEKVTYENAEVATCVRTRMRRRKRQSRANPDGTPGPRNAWIVAVEQAKAELDTPKFVIVRKEVRDPADETQVVGNKVYLRAVEIMAANKAAAAAAAPADEAVAMEE